MVKKKAISEFTLIVFVARVRTSLFRFSIHPNSILAFSYPVNCVTWKAIFPDFSLKEKHRNEWKETSKLASCHQPPGMISICLSPGYPSASFDQKGIPLQEMSVPQCPMAITSCEPGSPRQRSASFSLPAWVQKQKYNTYLCDYLGSHISL